ncbi:hypothetical protein VC83_03352 [Pseudogymnoascus destructans]|nr:uncharacterized protein VC83_03352 [Pseudogymnoascus destructans]OAF60709.1 hypothetical protein VC83_03352 [Pseudogymnoascus destructans]
MLSFLTINSIIVLTYVATTLVASASIKGRHMARDTTPLEPFDPNTTKYCSYWWDTEGSFTCQDFVNGWGLTLADFTRWNPSITATCGNFKTSGQSYCVEVDGEPVPTTTLPPMNTVTSRILSSTAITTTTSSGNGVATPTPTQPGMTTSCNAFRLVKSGDQCGRIAASAGISLDDFYAWNPSVGTTCATLLADDYVCVGVIGCTLISPLPSGQYCGRIGVPVAASGSGKLIGYSTGSPYVASVAAVLRSAWIRLPAQASTLLQEAAAVCTMGQFRFLLMETLDRQHFINNLAFNVPR